MKIGGGFIYWDYSIKSHHYKPRYEWVGVDAKSLNKLHNYFLSQSLVYNNFNWFIYCIAEERLSKLIDYKISS